ncbi:MAG TPA: beta-ketoacyl-ACP synthase II [Fimbriimonas sp.]|nr:beta-ketoacyl-ACP synthase II [Fimbriimonas sp.]
MRRRVVVTGIGVLTPLGNTPNALWSQILAGKSGVGPITHFDASRHDVKIAAEVKDFRPESFLDRRDAKRTDRCTQFALFGALEALKDARLTIDSTNAGRVGVLIGSGQGGFNTIEEQMRILIESGPDRVSPITVPLMIADMASGYVSIITGAKGPNSTVVTACATGANAIGDAAETIRRGAADVMIAGGCEAAITPLSVAAFGNSGAMCKKYVDEPERAARPFDGLRSGFVMGEGSGILVLEEIEHAKARGATIHAEVRGYGMSGDAYHITSPNPSGEGVAQAVGSALADAGISAGQIGYVNAHATSTQVGDKAEVQALKLALGEHAYQVPVSSTKGSTGHLLGAAGAVEAIVAIMALKNQIAPPAINQEQLDPECDIHIVRNTPEPTKISYAMSNNSGFGGHNAVLIFGGAPQD